MRACFRRFGVGTKRNSRPLQRRLLLAPSRRSRPSGLGLLMARSRHSLLMSAFDLADIACRQR